ncbi:hypothetical protein IFM89_028744 [Coptis chinensis]|uniref:Uncharacterized protein n=1 Tax=Coptis chinensis TaxID=261450 RepID=A0A835LFD3_9MAGN|nr:hypothetical protein IFM89_028744 [Coptis chinensis]
MAADVTTLVQILNGYLDEQQHLHHHQPKERRMDLITKDLIGISSSKDLLDLDSQVPSGWEKRLDLKSGKVYLQRSDSPTSSTITTITSNENDQKQKFQDLNFPPTCGGGGDEFTGFETSSII